MQTNKSYAPKTNTYFMIHKVAFIQNYTDTIVQNFRFAGAYQAQGFEVKIKYGYECTC